jgi:hypothetical protein
MAAMLSQPPESCSIRPKGLSKPPSVFTPTTNRVNRRHSLDHPTAPVSPVYRHRNFTLNKAKALTKKADHCNRGATSVAHKKGDNFTFQYNPGSFKIVRRALTHVLESMSNLFTKYLDLDRSGVHTQELLKVNFRRSSGKSLYTINLYLTTSLLMVNCTAPSKYEADIHPILEELIQKCTNLDEINQEIEQICRRQVAAFRTAKTV